MNKSVIIGAVVLVLAAGGYYQFSYLPAQQAAEEAAATAAREALSELHWEIVSVEKGPWVLDRRDLSDAEEQDHFDLAASEGECLVYHLWPVEPQDGDAIH